MRDRAAIAADLELADRGDRFDRQLAKHRLARDVPGLLADIDRLTIALADLGWVETTEEA